MLLSVFERRDGLLSQAISLFLSVYSSVSCLRLGGNLPGMRFSGVTVLFSLRKSVEMVECLQLKSIRKWL